MSMPLRNPSKGNINKQDKNMTETVTQTTLSPQDQKILDVSKKGSHALVASMLEEQQTKVSSDTITGFRAGVAAVTEVPTEKAPGVSLRGDTGKYAVRMPTTGGKRPTFGNYTSLAMANEVAFAVQHAIDLLTSERPTMEWNDAFESLCSEETEEPEVKATSTQDFSDLVLDEEALTWVNSNGEKINFV